jgi:hypothetical protein
VATSGALEATLGRPRAELVATSGRSRADLGQTSGRPRANLGAPSGQPRGILIFFNMVTLRAGYGTERLFSLDFANSIAEHLEFYTFVAKCIFEIHFSKEDKIIVSSTWLYNRPLNSQQNQFSKGSSINYVILKSAISDPLPPPLLSF